LPAARAWPGERFEFGGVYKLGVTYYAAHSNEFGYAHYEVIPTPQIAIDPLRNGYVAAVAQCRELADHRRLPRGDEK
jgi:hypothetical protein